MLVGFTLCQSCMGNHGCSKLMRAAATSCPKDISQHTHTLLPLRFFLIFFFFLNEGLDLPFRAGYP